MTIEEPAISLSQKPKPSLLQGVDVLSCEERPGNITREVMNAFSGRGEMIVSTEAPEVATPSIEGEAFGIRIDTRTKEFSAKFRIHKKGWFKMKHNEKG